MTVIWGSCIPFLDTDDLREVGTIDGFENSDEEGRPGRSNEEDGSPDMFGQWPGWDDARDRLYGTITGAVCGNPFTIFIAEGGTESLRFGDPEIDGGADAFDRRNEIVPITGDELISPFGPSIRDSDDDPRGRGATAFADGDGDIGSCSFVNVRGVAGVSPDDSDGGSGGRGCSSLFVPC
jgi:hypothetical protein